MFTFGLGVPAPAPWCCDVKKAAVLFFCQESKSRWRRVLKTLNLLEFLIKNGSERIIDEVLSVRDVENLAHTR